MLVPLARDLLTANSGKVALILVHDNVTCSLGKWLPLQAAKVPFHTRASAAVLSSRVRTRTSSARLLLRI
ncbi:hypothetical protein WJX75_002944 [Coccomyxa subellipsoidea]|uniref:Uncharacterized protein n=1 Tax=Coccomyxa subellipsoidea TaxID=248742 RepID=A0ABR2YVP6_9CHLO